MGRSDAAAKTMTGALIMANSLHGATPSQPVSGIRRCWRIVTVGLALTLVSSCAIPLTGIDGDVPPSQKPAPTDAIVPTDGNVNDKTNHSDEANPSDNTTAEVPAGNAVGIPAGNAPEELRTCEQPDLGDKFESVTPEEVGMDSDVVRAAIDYSTMRGAQSVRIYRNGCLIGTSVMDGDTSWTPLPAYSVTKGIVSLITGRAEQLGYLDVDDSIAKYFPEVSPAHARITVRHLLNQTSGLKFAWANDLNLAGTQDSVARTLERPFRFEPGEQFVYAQTTITVLAGLVERAVGMDFQEFARTEFFEKIGIPKSEWTWLRDSFGNTQGFAGLSITPRALGRIGSLMMEYGNWQGEQIIREGYMRDGSRGSQANPGYGYLWRANGGEFSLGNSPSLETNDGMIWPNVPEDAYGLSGMFEQTVTTIPSLGIVYVRMGLPFEIFPDPMGQVEGHNPRWDWRFHRLLFSGLLDQDYPDYGDWAPGPQNPLFEDVTQLIDFSYL